MDHERDSPSISSMGGSNTIGNVTEEPNVAGICNVNCRNRTGCTTRIWADADCVRCVPFTSS